MSSKLPPQDKKISWRKSLLWKFVRIFLITTVMGTLLHFFAYWFLESLFSDKLFQMAYWSKAKEYAFRLDGITSPKLELEGIHRKFVKFRSETPFFDFYLLNENGEVVYTDYERLTDGDTGLTRDDTGPEVMKRVSLLPIEKFLKTKGYPFFPVYGLNPSRSTKGPTPILAAKIQIEDKTGYLYIALKGRYYAELHQMLGDFFVAIASGLFLFAMSALIIFLGVMLSYVILRRFSNLTQAIESFTQGDYTTRVEHIEDDEIGIHAQSFNEMAETIENNIRQLKEGDELRRQLVANVYHDLRSPVAAMQQLLDVLTHQNDEIGAEEKQTMTERALSNCQDLNALLHDLFELSKLDAKTEKPKLESLDPKSLLRNVIKKRALEFQSSDLAIVLDTPKELPFVLADPKMINRVLSNLVGNAIRYSDPGGEIRLSASIENDHQMRIAVSDSGIGISDTDLEHVFQRFFRAARTEDKERGGTGLGLAIVKQIIDLHEQDISVESTLGKGSVFSFTLETTTNKHAPLSSL